MIRGTFFLVVANLTWGLDSFAEDISDFVDRSDAIGVISVYSGTEKLKYEIGNGCGVLYSGYVVDDIANLDKGSLVSFRTSASLTIASAYLVFLVDGIDSSADESSSISGLRAERCAESGVTLTAMIIGDVVDPDLGPPAIFERRKRPGGAADRYHRGDNYYFGSSDIEGLIAALPGGRPDCLDPIFANIELANYVAKGVLYPAEPFAEFLRDLANE